MAEQTSAERFEEWWEWGSDQGLSRNDARKVWDAATAAAEERHKADLGERMDRAVEHYGGAIHVLERENAALCQRIAELEGRSGG